MAEISATQWQELSSLLDELFDAQDEARALRLAQIRRSNEGLASRLETLLRQRTATERDGFLAKIELVRGQPEEARRKTEQVVTAFPDPQRAGGVLANALNCALRLSTGLTNAWQRWPTFKLPLRLRTDCRAVGRIHCARDKARRRRCRLFARRCRTSGRALENDAR